jgi:hypothetical protein
LDRTPRLRQTLFIARHAGPVYNDLAASLNYDRSDAWRFEVNDRKDFMRRAFHFLAFNGIVGDYAEFGCNGAVTFRLAWGAAQLSGVQRHFWGFDSFAGLPKPSDERDHHPKWVPGTMATSEAEFHALCREFGLPGDDYTVVPGFYEQTLNPSANGRRPSRIALAYVDCDLYSSTQAVLCFLEERLSNGSIVAFDDYFCYSPTQAPGERIAAADFLAVSRWEFVPYIQYGWHGMSFIAEQSNQRA